MMGTPACAGRRSRIFAAELIGTAAFVLGALSAMTALLVGVIVACVSSARLGRFTPLAIWPVLTLLIWLGALAATLPWLRRA